MIIDEYNIDDNDLDTEDNTERNSLNVASCEALFDPNSEVDMLTEVDVTQPEQPSNDPVTTEEIQNQFVNQNVMVIGVRINNESNESIGNRINHFYSLQRSIQNLLTRDHVIFAFILTIR